MRFLFIVLFAATLHAAYNPFFSEKPKEPKPQIKKSVPKPAPSPKLSPLTQIDITYFGYVQTDKGQFALLEMQNRTFAIRQGGNLYHGSSAIKVVKVSSNAIVLKNAGKYKTVYFSQKEQ